MATNLEPDEGRRAGRPTVGRHGEASVRLTAQDIISVAVNCRQNGWDYPDWLVNILGCDSIDALDAMMDEIYEQILEANRRAVSKTFDEKGSTGGRVRR